MASGLTDEQIAQLRDEVTAGKSPRVRIASSQFDGGTVRHVGDPAVDGEDYVTVRVKADGVTDDLRFAPRELSRGKNTPAKRAATMSRAPARADAKPAARREATAATRTVPEPAPEFRPARPRRKTAAPATAPAPVAPAPEPPRTEPARKRGGRKAAPTASVTITLKSAGTSWTVGVQRGAKSVAKSVDVNPGVVSAVAGLLQVPSLEEAVAAVNDAARIEAEIRADELRAELARIQTVLDSHRLP